MNTDGKLSRRGMLKYSGASLVAAGVSLALPGTMGAEASGGMADGGAALPAFARRRRPACLDIAWSRGTGLIWMAGEALFYENPRNRFMRFRRVFHLKSAPMRAELRLFADTHYIAWLNGVEVGRGPGRSDPTWTYFDTYDVGTLLRTGDSTLAVLVLFQGFGTGGRHSIMQAMMAHLDVESTDGTHHYVVSDRSWKASPAAEFIRPSPRLHATLGCAEVQDMRLGDEGWQKPGYRDEGWSSADYVKPDLVNTPWYNFVPDPLPTRRLDPLPFPPTARKTAVALTLPAVAELGAIRQAPASGEETSLPVHVAGEATNATVVTLDLGRTECGFLALEVDGPDGATLDVLCGEMLVDGQVPKPGSARVHTTRFILRGGRQTLRVAFNWIAFRFAQLWVWTPEPLEVRDAVLYRIPAPLGDGGHFRCNDDFLNRLDAACEHTLRLCAKDGILDSSSREQQQWMGDGRFTAITLQHRFAAGTLHRRLIEQIGQGIDWQGTMVPRFPTGNLNVSPIPLYSLQWVLAFKDYGWFTGDASLLDDWLPLILHVLRWFTTFERGDGLLEGVPYWMYIDIGEEKDGRRPVVGLINTTLNLYYYAALRFVAEATAGDPRLARALGDRASTIATALRAALWDESAGLYWDSLDASGRPTTVSEGTNANALVHLEPSGSFRAKRIIEAVFVRRTSNPIMASPFMMNAVFDGLARHERADLVFPILASRYPEQVKTGSTWEHWHSHTTGRTPTSASLSHAWGAGALAFFVNAVVGIRPAAAGWAKVRIAPQPGPLTQAEASVVTVAGRVFASWEVANSAFRLRVDLPREVAGTCRLPDGHEAEIPAGGGVFTCKAPVPGGRI